MNKFIIERKELRENPTRAKCFEIREKHKEAVCADVKKLVEKKGKEEFTKIFIEAQEHQEWLITPEEFIRKEDDISEEFVSWWKIEQKKLFVTAYKKFLPRVNIDRISSTTGYLMVTEDISLEAVEKIANEIEDEVCMVEYKQKYKLDISVCGKPATEKGRCGILTCKTHKNRKSIIILKK